MIMEAERFSTSGLNQTSDSAFTPKSGKYLRRAARKSSGSIATAMDRKRANFAAPFLCAPNQTGISWAVSITRSSVEESFAHSSDDPTRPAGWSFEQLRDKLEPA